MPEPRPRADTIGTRETLLDFFADRLQSNEPFLVYDDGFRARYYSYARVGAAAHTFAQALRGAGIVAGEKVILWGENRPEWIVALWGCLLAGVVAVPLDYRSSEPLARRVQELVAARLVVVGEEVPGLPFEPGVTVWRMAEWDWSARGDAPPHTAKPDDLAEILFTSGATADPKGVLISHRNLLANIVPVEREVVRYARKYYRWPFRPVRFLNLLPLSHLFGQAMATFVPAMLPGIVVFQRGYQPAEIVRQIHSRRISVLVCVPKILEVLREHVLRLFPEIKRGLAPGGTAARWWRYRQVHRLFGFKFWAFVVGAAPLDPELEEFWGRLGFAVIQGYGLTETAPIVTLNHPFHTRRGTVGKPIAGVEIRIADDGEILVKGENVTSGYYGAAEGSAFDAEGWFHTGDIGFLDKEGRLQVRGRKKEMIVTPEGLNIFPEDVERVLNQRPGVVESAVVGPDRVHAVLVLQEGAEPEAVIRESNRQLEEHQMVRGYSLWPEQTLPRTEGTRKLKRRAIQDWVQTGARATRPSEEQDTITGLLSPRAGGRTLTADTTLTDLGLSSLERVELMVALEQKLGTSLDETAFAQACTVADLRQLAARPPAATGEAVAFPRWARSGWARAVRNLSLATWILPLNRLFVWSRVEGLEHLRNIQGPVLFASNHQSYMDTPTIYAALPWRWRLRLSTAMAKEFFRAWFHPEGHAWFTHWRRGLDYFLAVLFFNAVPLPQREAGARDTMRYLGELFGEGYSVLVFPEGKHTDQGEINRFLPGVGMMAARLDVPVVPVFLQGMHRVLHRTWRMARPGRVRVRFGAPLRLQGQDYAALATEVEAAVRALAGEPAKAGPSPPSTGNN